MLDRFEPVLKIVCLALAVLLLAQVGKRLAHPDPLGSASIPPLPALSPPKAPPTNSISQTNTVKGSNIVGAAKEPKRHGNAGPHFGAPKAAHDLPSFIQARVDHIKESEILGPFIRPMPMALLGIADDDAFLRGPDGQTGMVKEGGELGGIKLLRIGINRVLIEQDGEKKELTVFNGFGSDSLLPKEPPNSTNTTNTPNEKDNP